MRTLTTLFFISLVIACTPEKQSPQLDPRVDLLEKEVIKLRTDLLQVIADKTSDVPATKEQARQAAILSRNTFNALGRTNTELDATQGEIKAQEEVLRNAILAIDGKINQHIIYAQGTLDSLKRLVNKCPYSKMGK